MKKLMGILLAASMVFSLAACGSTADTAASSAAGTTATAEGSSNNQAPDVKVGAIILGDETEATAPRTSTASRKLPPSWACPMTDRLEVQDR